MGIFSRRIFFCFLAFLFPSSLLASDFDITCDNHGTFTNCTEQQRPDYNQSYRDLGESLGNLMQAIKKRQLQERQLQAQKPYFDMLRQKSDLAARFSDQELMWAWDNRPDVKELILQTAEAYDETVELLKMAKSQDDIRKGLRIILADKNPVIGGEMFKKFSSQFKSLPEHEEPEEKQSKAKMEDAHFDAVRKYIAKRAERGDAEAITLNTFYENEDALTNEQTQATIEQTFSYLDKQIAKGDPEAIALQKLLSGSLPK